MAYFVQGMGQGKMMNKMNVLHFIKRKKTNKNVCMMPAHMRECSVKGRGGQRINFGMCMKSKPRIRMVTKIDLDLSFLVIKFSFAYLLKKKKKNPSIEV